MRISIICPGLEMMPIIAILKNFDLELEIIFSHNTSNIFWCEKDYFVSTLQNLCNLATWEKIIFPIAWEILLNHQKDFWLFKFLAKKFLELSRVGKIGLFSQNIDFFSQENIKQFFNNFQPLECQKIRKGFENYKLFFIKSNNWNQIWELWNRHFMLSKLIKFDMKKVKDYNLDSLLPMSYQFLEYSRLINNKLLSKMNFLDQKFCQKNVEEMLKTCWINKWDAKIDFVFESWEQIYRSNRKYAYLFREN